MNSRYSEIVDTLNQLRHFGALGFFQYWYLRSITFFNKKSLETMETPCTCSKLCYEHVFEEANKAAVERGWDGCDDILMPTCFKHPDKPIECVKCK